MRSERARRRGPYMTTLTVIAAVIAAGAILIAAAEIADRFLLRPKRVLFGVTFSKPYAEELGLDWKEAYIATLDDLGVRRLRIPAYWDAIEPEDGIFRFDDLDWQIGEASKRDARLIIAVGRKLPRWPECYVPDWATRMDEAARERRISAMIETVVRRYRENDAIIAWQVENEPFYSFGRCGTIHPSIVAKEADLVRALDDRPVLMQDIGEFSFWLRTARMTDTLGVSMYRDIWNPFFGDVRWPGLAAWYRLRGALARRHATTVIIGEMQAEPWVTRPMIEVPIDEQLRRMNAGKLADNSAFVRRIGFPEAYVWGVEWWYWLKTKGHPELWDAGRLLFSEASAENVAR